MVRDSVLFFNNRVESGARLTKVVSDVNTTFGAGALVGGQGADQEVTVLGWNNQIPAGTVIGSDCTIYPHLQPEKFGRVIKHGEIIR